jgi:hypothetical protein
VEFAGDFMTQQSNGAITSPNADGVIDFHYDLPNQTRSVRWYGFPRDTTGDGTINKADGDVLPVGDVIGSAVSFEKPPLITSASGYPLLDPTPVPPVYTAAWGPQDVDSRPKMLRITFAIDDPNGRFSDPMTFEYVFKVP